MKKLFIFFLVLLTFTPQTFAVTAAETLLQQARRERATRVKHAIQEGAKVEFSEDGKSFYLLWLPPGTSPKNPPPMVVSLHGHDGWAFDDFYVWESFLKDRGYGLVALQWWLGEGERTEDYLSPDEMYSMIDSALQHLNVKPGTVLLHGFSRGSANSYAVAARDRASGKKYFALIISNAGRAAPDYPPTREITEGRFGPQPFLDTHWVTFAGGKDPNPNRDGVEGMRKTAEWIKKLGGTIDLAIEDSEAGHGGFHRNPQNTNTALDDFDKRRPA